MSLKSLAPLLITSAFAISGCNSTITKMQSPLTTGAISANDAFAIKTPDFTKQMLCEAFTFNTNCQLHQLPVDTRIRACNSLENQETAYIEEAPYSEDHSENHSYEKYQQAQFYTALDHNRSLFKCDKL